MKGTLWIQKAAPAGILGLLLVAAGCSGGKPDADKPGGGMQDYRQQALYDRDSRNNEDPSLGVKSRWVGEQEQRQAPHQGSAPLDMTNRHLANAMTFDPAIAEKVKSLPGIQDAHVLLTEVNAYVAVVLDGHSPENEANPNVKAYRIQGKSGLGLFGADEGANRINWSEPGGLSTSQADDITQIVGKAAPTNVTRVYVSANPNFVQRVRVYAQEEREKGSMTAYLNEFNTLVQRVFQNDFNTRK